MYSHIYYKMSKQIQSRLSKYIAHKSSTLSSRVYLAVIDKIFDAENYDEFEIDSDNNIYITYSLKRDESIIDEAQDLISDQIKRKYRKKLEEQLEEEGYFVEYDDSEIHVFFEEPLKTEDVSVNSDFLRSNQESNIINYKKPTLKDIIVADIDFSNDENIFNFGKSEDDDKK